MLATLAALALAQANALPITDVTVFSDRARITRAGTLAVSGRQKLELATLLDSTDTSSLVVEAQGAELETVEILPLDEEQLPVAEARTLLKQLEENADASAKLNGELAAVRAQLSQVAALSPQVPTAGQLAAPPKLSSAGWSAAVTFSADQLGRLQTKERDLAVKAFDLAEKRTELQARAAQLGGAQRRSGWKIVAAVKGNGPARFSINYVAFGARWYPTYDVQLMPDTGKVQVAFAGLVSQETGEDWADAALTLSTAIPSQANEFPKLLTWKIGTKERFIPTPTPVGEIVRPPPPALPLPTADRREQDLLRAALAANTNGLDDRFTANLQEKEKSYDAKRRLKSFAPEERPRAAPPPPPVAMQAQNQPGRSYGAVAAAPAAAADSYDEEPSPQQTKTMAMEVSVASTSSRSSGPSYRRSAMGMSPPPGWVRPSYAAELPASAGGGYDLAWPSLQKETVQSGKGARRVALFTQTWPVNTERKLYPALFSESFLVAELKNPAAWPLPAGNANLFVGADPAGTAALKLVSPGETFTLPLGIDRALKPIRNVKVVDAEKGVFSKDDFSEYTVTIQLANPYRAPVAVRLYDQVPVTDDKEVEIALLETKPQAKLDKVRGHLEWRLTVPASGKTEVSFKYTLKRPKGWRMNQWEVQQ